MLDCEFRIGISDLISPKVSASHVVRQLAYSAKAFITLMLAAQAKKSHLLEAHLEMDAYHYTDDLG